MPEILFAGTKFLFDVIRRGDAKVGNDRVKEDKWLSVYIKE